MISTQNTRFSTVAVVLMFIVEKTYASKRKYGQYYCYI